MEGAVEDCDVRESREQAPGLSDRSQGRSVVQRRELDRPRQLQLNGVVDQDRLEKPWAPVNDAMNDRVEVVRYR